MISYKPLWRVLVERDMSKSDLRKNIGIAPNTMTKMRKNEEVSLTVLSKICSYLNINFCDVIEFIPDSIKENGGN